MTKIWLILFLSSIPLASIATSPTRNLYEAINRDRVEEVKELVLGYPDIVNAPLNTASDKPSAQKAIETCFLLSPFGFILSIWDRLLFGNDGDILNRKPFDEGWTSLMVAAYKENTQIASILVEHGAQVNNLENLSPLGIAVNKNNIAMSELLINAGADTNAISYGVVPLILAIWNNNKNMVDLLLEKGAYINFQVTHAAIKKNNAPIITLLLTRGADVDDEVISWAALNCQEDPEFMKALKARMGTTPKLTVDDSIMRWAARFCEKDPEFIKSLKLHMTAWQKVKWKTYGNLWK